MTTQTSDTAQQINGSLHALIHSYGASANLQKDAEQLIDQLYLVFSLKDDFMKKLSAMDEVFDKYSAFRELQEATFDLLMVRYLATDTAHFDAEYFESEEWTAIEDATLDRGTELLNILIYIKEAVDVEAEITIDDFLEEFLLTDDENFSEEQEIYALLIDNKELIEVSISEWVQLYKTTDNDDAMKEYILPLFSLFSEDVTEEDFNAVVSKEIDDSALIIAYNSLLTTFAGK